MNNLIIYDFDDTLFPSYSYVSHILKIQNVKAFQIIDDLIYELLEYSLTFGDVMILSDGDIGWLYEVLSHIPKTNKLIDEKIPLISTVVYYEDLFRKDVHLYKLNYIRENINIDDYDVILNIGDGQNELRASIELFKEYGNKIKHISLIYRSSLKEWKEENIKLKNELVKDLINSDKQKYVFEREIIDEDLDKPTDI